MGGEYESMAVESVRPMTILNIPSVVVARPEFSADTSQIHIECGIGTTGAESIPVDISIKGGTPQFQLWGDNGESVTISDDSIRVRKVTKKSRTITTIIPWADHEPKKPIRIKGKSVMINRGESGSVQITISGVGIEYALYPQDEDTSPEMISAILKMNVKLGASGIQKAIKSQDVKSIFSISARPKG